MSNLIDNMKFGLVDYVALCIFTYLADSSVYQMAPELRHPGLLSPNGNQLFTIVKIMANAFLVFFLDIPARPAVPPPIMTTS